MSWEPWRGRRCKARRRIPRKLKKRMAREVERRVLAELERREAAADFTAEFVRTAVHYLQMDWSAWP